MSRPVNKKHGWLLLALALGMFGFAFALVPLYNVICEITGINGKTSQQATLQKELAAAEQGTDRVVSIGLLARVARGLPWEFRPLVDQLKVQPGVMNTTAFYVRNRSHKTITAQAVPSVSPGQAAQYLEKIECFCFEQQQLPPGGEMEMSVSFFVAAGLPPEIGELTLSYTMFHLVDAEHEHLTGRHD